MRYAPLILAAVLLGFAPASASAADTAPATATGPAPAADTAGVFTDAQRTAIEAIIHDYIAKKNPEVLMEAAQALQKQEMGAAQVKSQEAISKDKEKIYNNPNSPVGGNPKGDVTIVEFYDYQCGYCKMSEPVVEKLLKEDKNVKFVYKDYPILGPESVQASKASFASVRQGKFAKFHDALMGKKEHLTDDIIYQVGKDTGLDVEKLKKDMADPAIEKLVEESLALGNQLGVRGTPMFIVGEQIYPGALQYDQLKKAVDDARAAPKK